MESFPQYSVWVRDPSPAGKYLYEYAVRLAEKDNAEYEIPLILGSIMAHKIGHLILGTSSHFSEGIMKPRWARQQINQILTGNLVFTSEQSQILRARAGFYLRAASEIKTQDFIAARAYPAKGDR